MLVRELDADMLCRISIYDSILFKGPFIRLEKSWDPVATCRVPRHAFFVDFRHMIIPWLSRSLIYMTAVNFTGLFFVQH